MKTLKLLLVLSMFSYTGLFAQPSRKDKRKAVKVALITERVGITADEATVFWPIYNAMEAELRMLRQNFRKVRRKGKKMDELSDEEIEEILIQSFDFKAQEIALRKKYHVKFKKVLPIKKIAKLYHVDRRLNDHVRKRMRE